MIGRGKYRFRKEFKHLQCEEEVWFRMSREQREKHLKKVANATMSAYDELATTAHQPADLPLDPAKFLNIPFPSVQGNQFKVYGSKQRHCYLSLTLLYQPLEMVL